MGNKTQNPILGNYNRKVSVTNGIKCTKLIDIPTLKEKSTQKNKSKLKNQEKVKPKLTNQQKLFRKIRNSPIPKQTLLPHGADQPKKTNHTSGKLQNNSPNTIQSTKSPTKENYPITQEIKFAIDFSMPSLNEQAYLPSKTQNHAPKTIQNKKSSTEQVDFPIDLSIYPLEEQLRLSSSSSDNEEL